MDGHIPYSANCYHSIFANDSRYMAMEQVLVLAEQLALLYQLTDYSKYLIQTHQNWINYSEVVAVDVEVAKVAVVALEAMLYHSLDSAAKLYIKIFK